MSNKWGCPTVQDILKGKLEDIKLKIKPNTSSDPVFKAVVYSSDIGSLDISTSLFKNRNGTNDTLTNFIRDYIIKQISDHNETDFDSGIKKVSTVDDLTNELNKIDGTNLKIPDFSSNSYNSLFTPSGNDNTTLKVVKYNKKKTVVSTRFYQLKMKQLLVLICDRVQYYLNNIYPNVPNKDISEYLLNLREEIKTKVIELNKYLFNDSSKKVNTRGLLKKIVSSYDIKKNKDFLN